MFLDAVLVYNFLLDEPHERIRAVAVNHTKGFVRQLCYTNPNYWQRLRTENKSYKVQNRLKKDFNLILNEYNLNSLKEDLKYKLAHKFWELINQNEKELFEPISKEG